MILFSNEKITDTFLNVLYLHSLKQLVFFFLSNYKEEHAQILKFGKRRRGKRGKVIQNNSQGYLWLHLSICPSKLFPKYTHTNAHFSKMFSYCTSVACFFHLAGQCIFSSILIFLGTILSGCLTSPFYRCSVIYLTNPLSLDS